MTMLFISKRRKATRLSVMGLAVVFLATYMMVFSLDISQAVAQEKFGEAKPNMGTGTFGTPYPTATTNSGFGTLFNNQNYNANGNFTTPQTYFQQPQFGSANQNTQQLQHQQSGVIGFFRGLFSGSTTSTNLSTYTNNAYVNGTLTNVLNTSYTNTSATVNPYSSFGGANTNVTAGYNYNPYANNPYYANQNQNSYYTNNTTGLNNTYSNAGRLAGQRVGGVVGGFLGGMIDVVSFVGGKIVYGGNKMLVGLGNTANMMGNGIGVAATGLVGTMGKVLGFGGRLILGAAKVALTVPILALKAAVFLTTVATVGTVKVLGAGLSLLSRITGNAAVGLNTLGNNISGLYNQTQVLGNQNVNYQYGTNGYPSNFNNQQFGTNLNNTYNYTNTLQQNYIAQQNIVNGIQTGAQKTMSTFGANVRLAGISILELGAKLAYGTAKLVSGAASSVSLALAQSIMNMENTKANLRAIKQMNKMGVVNPYLYNQYLTQSQQNVNNSRNLFGTANQNVNNAYFGTLTNINGTRNYILQNSNSITSQMNQISGNNVYYNSSLPLNTLNQYNSNLNTLNTTYGHTFGQAQIANQNTVVTGQSSNPGLLSNLGFNEGTTAERTELNKDNAEVRTGMTAIAAGSPESKKAQENYMAAYDKYIKLLSEEEANSADVTNALEEYKSSYAEYEKIANGQAASK